MPTFAVRTSNSKPETVAFFDKAHAHLQEKNILRNPYTGGVKRLKDNLWLFHFEVLYPRVFLFGSFLFAGPLLVFREITWWLLPGFIMSATYVFWTRYWYFMFMWLGKKKQGIKAHFRLVKDSELIEEVVYSGSD